MFKYLGFLCPYGTLTDPEMGARSRGRGGGLQEAKEAHGARGARQVQVRVGELLETAWQLCVSPD